MTATAPVATDAGVPVRDVGSQLRWYGAALGVFFAVSWFGSDVVDLHHDLFLGLYFAAATFFVRYARATGIEVRRSLTAWFWPSVILGLLVAGFVVSSVLREPSTARPDGVYLAFELLWRGVIYGVVDAMVLTVFPYSVASGIVDTNLRAGRRRLAVAAVALPLIWMLTFAYHVGYQQFRGAEMVAPEIGNTAISVPMLVTSNPVGSILAHTSMHVVATVHAYETDIYLPPQTEAP